MGGQTLAANRIGNPDVMATILAQFAQVDEASREDLMEWCLRRHAPATASDHIGANAVDPKSK